jgi:hypothetical protein
MWIEAEDCRDICRHCFDNSCGSRSIGAVQNERDPMSFKFLVGQAVEYTPIGEKVAGFYRIKKQMPREEQAFDLRYRIKSEAEAFERNVLECQLSSDVRPECEYATTNPRPRLSQGSHRT